MRLRPIGLLAVVVLVGTSTWLPAAEPNIDELTRELKGERPAAKRTAQQLDAVYVKVLAALMPDMGSDDIGKRGRGQSTLERIAFRAGRPGADAHRLACAKALATQLGPDISPPARVWVLRQIERIGRREVVAALAKALADKDALVRESARRALRKNSSPEANAALRKAIASARQPAWRVALLNALADRRDPSNLPLLLSEAKSDDDDVRSAAIVGLAKVGDKSATGTIAAGMRRGSAKAKRIATDSYVRLADALVAKGDKAAALGLYKRLLGGKGHLRCAGLIGIGRAGGAADLPALFGALADADVRVRGACVEALTMMPGRDVTDAIAVKAKTAEARIKPALLRALAARGDKGTTPIFLAAAEDADESVKAEALRGLGLVGDAAAVPVLLKMAAAPGKQQEAARASLEWMAAAGVDKALLAAVDAEGPKIRTEAVRALSARRVTAATPALLKAAEDTDGGVRGEAMKALGAVAATGALPAVADLLLKAKDDASRNEAANALVRIAGRESDTEKRAGPILKALASAGGAAKLSLLGVAGRIGGQAPLQAMRAAVKDTDEKVRDAAVRALANWPDATAAKDLLDVARSAPNETLHVIAIRGYIRVLRLRSRRPAAQSAKMLTEGLQAAKRPQEKKQALAALAEVRDVAALHAASGCLGDDALKEEAARAAVRVAQHVWSRDLDAVKAAMQKALDVAKNRDTRRRAKEILDRVEKRQKEAAKRK